MALVSKKREKTEKGIWDGFSWKNRCMGPEWEKEYK